MVSNILYFHLNTCGKCSWEATQTTSFSNDGSWNFRVRTWWWRKDGKNPSKINRWNLKITIFSTENHLSNLHDCVPCYFFRCEILENHGHFDEFIRIEFLRTSRSHDVSHGLLCPNGWKNAFQASKGRKSRRMGHQITGLGGVAVFTYVEIIWVFPKKKGTLKWMVYDGKPC